MRYYQAKSKKWRHHCQRDQKNPFFDRHVRRPCYGWYFSATIFILLILIYLALSLNYFKISQPEIFGNIRVNTQSVIDLFNQQAQNKKMLFFQENNLWLFNSRKLEKAIDQNNNIEDVQIKKTWPNRLTINIKEKGAVLILQINNVFYKIDKVGLAFEQLAAAPENILPQVKIIRPSLLAVGNKALETNLLDFILTLNRQLAMQNIKIDYYQLESLSASQITAQTAERWIILFDARENLLDQIYNLKTVLSEKVKDRNKLQKIDLRFGDKIYFQ